MSEQEEPQFTTLAQRIAALKQSQASDAGTPSAPTNNLRLGKPPPPPAPKPAIDRPVNNLRTASVPNGSALDTHITNLPAGSRDVAPPPILDREMKDRNLKLSDKFPKKPPPLPGRKISSPNLAIEAASHPPLPQRKPSDQLAVVQATRKPSNESLRSNFSNSGHSTYSYGGTKSTASSIDTHVRKLPPRLEDTVLPPLPPSRKQQQENEVNARQARASVISSRSAPAIPRITRQGEADVPPVPKLPSRTTAPALPSRFEAPPLPSRTSNGPSLPTRPKANAAILGFSSGRSENPPAKPARPTPSVADGPPPIPISSRPTESQLAALRSKQNLQTLEPTPEAETSNSCLVCRDFTGPDHTATLHPRQSLPTHNALQYLASNLCAPFPSPTDKARAIFTWCHHNIAYDWERFLRNDISHDSQSPSSTLRSGLAVCAGYAGLYAALAIAAGLQCVVINGHGKGYGFTFTPGVTTLPEYETNHAWNAIFLPDWRGGAWKLLDPCWGAGHLGGDNRYHAQFSPLEFCWSNVEFGRKHFPDESGMQWREDGRRVGWEEYLLGQPPYGEPVQTWGGHEKQFVDIYSLSPPLKTLDVSGTETRTVRFQIFKLCPHYKFPKPPYLLGLQIPERPGDGYCGNIIPLHFNGDVWWVDVPINMLGPKGSGIKLQIVDEVGGKDGRGVTRDEFIKRRKVRGGYDRGGLGAIKFAGLAAWTVG